MENDMPRLECPAEGNRGGMAAESGRWEYIDLIESIGIFFVLTYHLLPNSYPWMEDPRGIFFLEYYMQTILPTCVPLFFFANGYLLLNRPFDLRKHLVKMVKLVFLTGIWGGINILLLMPPLRTSICRYGNLPPICGIGITDGLIICGIWAR